MHLPTLKKQLLPFFRPQLSRDTFSKFIQDSLRLRGDVREEVHKFELEFARYIGTKYAIVLPSGRFCISLLLKFFNCAKKNVILPAYTCIPAPASVLWANAKPYFIDIELNTYNLAFNPKLIKTKNIGAIMPTYLYGLVGEIEDVFDYAKDKRIPIIEDAAIAIGAEYQNKKVGSLGDAGIFSLQNSKILSGWRGGIITTNNEELARFVLNERKKLLPPSFLSVFFHILLMHIILFLSQEGLYGFTLFPFNTFLIEHDIRSGAFTGTYKPLPKTVRRISSLQTAMARTEFKKIEEILEKRKDNAKYLTKHLREIVVVPKEIKVSKHVYGRYPIRIEGVNKFVFGNAMLKRGIEVGYYYPYICPSILHKNLSDVSKRFPNSLTASKETILLPVDALLKKSQLVKVVDSVISAIKEIKNV